MAAKGTSCELCNSEAKTFCESDQAMLCWECDDKVHSANFLVAKHTRTALCRVCHSLTPWKSSGVKLGRIVTVCDDCVARSTGVGAGSAEALSGEELQLDDDCCDYDDDDSSSDDDENQVVPWTSTPPPATSTSGSEEEESSGDASESTILFSNVEIGASSSASPSMAARTCPPDELIRPLKQRKIVIQSRKHN